MQITSPTGSSPAPSEGSTPPANDYTNIEANGLKLPMPKRVAFAVSIIIMLMGAIPVVSQVLLPMFEKYTATSKADTSKAEAEKAQADAEAAGARAKKEKLEQEATRFKEYQNHFNESPKTTQKLFDSPDLGMLSVSFYPSDGCLLVKRKGPGHNQAEMSYWIAARSIPLEAPPGATDAARESRLETSPQNQPSLNATYRFASFNPDSAPPLPPSVVGCADTHPGQFQTWNGEKKGCWIQVWRRWPDGCQHYQWFNTCNGYRDSQESGAPRVSWTNCIH